MKTLDYLRQNRAEIYKIAEKYGVSNIRVFGSVARGEETKKSDVDFLVKVTNYKKYCKGSWGNNNFAEEIAQFLHKKVDIVTEKSVHPLLKKEINTNAKTL